MKSKIISLIILFLTISLSIDAQKFSNIDSNNHILNLKLNEVIIKAEKLFEYQNRVKSQNIQLVFNGATDSFHHGWDSTYFLTRFPKLDNRQIKINKLKCKLHSFDTALFTVQIIVYQVVGGDTQINIVRLKNNDEIRKDKLTVNLSDYDINLMPTTFFIGFGFITKDKKTEYKYRLFSSIKGEGLMIAFNNGKMDFYSNSNLPCTFPFTIIYSRL